jgi:hypothetical protein
MSNISDEQLHQQLTFFAGGSPVKTSALLDAVMDWMESDQSFGLSSYELLQSLNQSGLLSKTSLACYPPMSDETLPSSFQGWRNAGIGGPIGFLTLSISEWPKDAAVCSLSDALETGEVPQKYYLSPKAAHGILRRAERRGRELPRQLKQALLAVVEEEAGP